MGEGDRDGRREREGWREGGMEELEVRREGGRDGGGEVEGAGGRGREKGRER